MLTKPKVLACHTIFECYEGQTQIWKDSLAKALINVYDFHSELVVKFSSLHIYNTRTSTHVRDKGVQKHSGHHCTEKIARTRLEEAKHPLLTTELNMSKIATRSSIASVIYFLQAFSASFSATHKT